MKISELMTQNPSVCHPDTSLHDVVREMVENDCGSIPVVSADGQRKVLGMITDRDVCMAAYAKEKPLKALSVESAMSRTAVTCRPDEDVSVAEERMTECKVRRMPVVDERGELTGLLSLAQIARASANGPSGQVSESEVGHVLASIVQPMPERRVEPTG